MDEITNESANRAWMRCTSSNYPAHAEAKIRVMKETIDAIDKEIRGQVCDPDPLPQMFPNSLMSVTTYGLVAGLKRERDALLIANADLSARLAEYEKNVSTLAGADDWK